MVLDLKSVPESQYTVDLQTAIGYEPLWSIIPAIDLLKYVQLETRDVQPMTATVTVIGVGDIASVLLTSVCHQDCQISFNIYEDKGSNLSRSIFFYYLSQDVSISIKQKVDLFQVFHGCLKVRPEHHAYMNTAIKRIRDEMLYSDTISVGSDPSIQGLPNTHGPLDGIRMKTKDEIDQIFELWVKGLRTTNLGSKIPSCEEKIKYIDDLWDCRL